MTKKKSCVPVLRLRSPLGMALEEYRLAVNLELPDLAKQARLTTRTVRHIEGSHRPRPTNDTLRRLADALGVDFEHLCRLRLFGLRHPITVGHMKEDAPDYASEVPWAEGFGEQDLF